MGDVTGTGTSTLKNMTGAQGSGGRGRGGRGGDLCVCLLLHCFYINAILFCMLFFPADLFNLFEFYHCVFLLSFVLNIVIFTSFCSSISILFVPFLSLFRFIIQLFTFIYLNLFVYSLLFDLLMQ